MRAPSRVTMRESNGERWECGKGRLAAGWRRTGKEPGTPEARTGERPDDCFCLPQCHQHHNRRGGGDRRGGVQHHANRTQVGIRSDRVNVRDLDHGQQRRQQQAHYTGERKDLKSGAGSPTYMCLLFGHIILQQDTRSLTDFSRSWLRKCRFSFRKYRFSFRWPEIVMNPSRRIRGSSEAPASAAFD